MGARQWSPLGALLLCAAMTAWPAATASASVLPVYHAVKTTDPVVFITIDDGIDRPADALAYVRKHQIPVTSFLTSSTIRGHEKYFAAMSEWGSIQNHTTTHKDLNYTSTDVRQQICPVETTYHRAFGTKPWMLRPPYGDGPYNSYVQTVAESCGITRIVVWNAVVAKGKLTTWNGSQLSAGAIILLHYTNNLAWDLKVAVSAAHQQGFDIANLDDYLRAPQDRTPGVDPTPVPG